MKKRWIAVLMAIALGFAGAAGKWAWTTVEEKAFSQGKEAGVKQERQRFVQKFEAAPLVYLQDIERQIMKPLPETLTPKESTDAVLVQARVIVSMRDERRDSLTIMAKLLNSTIDKLDTVVKAQSAALPTDTIPPPTPELREMTLLIKELQQSWPEKKGLFKIQMRKQLVDAGLVEQEQELDSKKANKL